MHEHKSLARLRARWAAIGAAITVTLGAGTIATVGADGSSDDASVFTPITACRLTDTRSATQVGPRSVPLGGNDTMTVNARGAQGECTAADLPAGATALSLNVTALQATERTFFTFWPSGARPNAASLNPAPNQPPTPNAVTVPLSSTGTFNLFNLRGSVHTVIDVVGYYTSANPAPTESSVELSLGFSTGSEWEFGSFGTWERSAGATDCIVFPIDVPEGRSVSAVDVRYLGTSGSADIAIYATALNPAPGTELEEDDLIKRLLVNDVDAPQTASGELRSISVVDNRSTNLGLGLGTIPTSNMPAQGTATLHFCSDDSITLVGLIVSFGDPI